MFDHIRLGRKAQSASSPERIMRKYQEYGFLSVRLCRWLEGIAVRIQPVSRDPGQCWSIERKLWITRARRRIGAYLSLQALVFRTLHSNRKNLDVEHLCYGFIHTFSVFRTLGSTTRHPNYSQKKITLAQWWRSFRTRILCWSCGRCVWDVLMGSGYWLFCKGQESHMYDVQIKGVVQAAHLLLIPLNWV